MIFENKLSSVQDLFLYDYIKSETRKSNGPNFYKKNSSYDFFRPNTKNKSFSNNFTDYLRLENNFKLLPNHMKNNLKKQNFEERFFSNES